MFSLPLGRNIGFTEHAVSNTGVILEGILLCLAPLQAAAAVKLMQLGVFLGCRGK
jgi:hypothetical protein